MSEKEFYKKIHPNLFSDSKIVKKGKLTDDYFSYFLESLTSQSKEKEFEDYCRKIVSVTICPNLLPQTGPTGGGDSKVDSETFPVSETIAESWLSGYGDLAHSERWAFAISAKKEWKSKFKSDVQKIIGTNTENGRNYKKIFFITNQFVSDKKRASAEDELRNEYELDIRILDRTWLLENTFKNNNQILAIEAFHMSEDLLDVVEEGSKDLERRRRLMEINDELSNIESLKPARIVKLSEESVEIIRELEVDKLMAVEALERNIRFTKKYGHSQNYINALYDFCWTILWWYEDHDMYYEKYLEIEEIYKEKNDNYPILNKLSTLWITLQSNHNKNKKIIDSMDNHTKLLEDSFDRFIRDEENPKRARLARFDYQMMRMQNPDLWDDVVEEYLKILEDMNYNNDIDLFQLKRVLELPILKNSPHYDMLFEKLIDLLGEQSKNVSSSQLLINRGDDYLENKVYTSISYYSRALSRLYQEESKIDLIKTLMKLGTAFEKIGLMWSARSYYIRAFMDSFNLYFEEGTAIPGIFLTMRTLKRLELSLGRLGYSLEMNELELRGLDLYPYETNEEEEIEKYSYYDGLLAIYILNLSIDRIERINTLPDYLSDIELYMSAAAIKYKLGYYDKDYVEALGSNQKVDEFMTNLFNQPASIDFQKNINIDDLSDKVVLRTKIIGCNVTIEMSSGRHKQEFGASLLAMLENIFATSVVEKIIPLLGAFNIEIIEGSKKEFGIDVQQNDNNVKVIVSQVDGLIEFGNRETVFEKMYSIVAIFISQMLTFEKDFQRFKAVLEEENTMFRCFSHSNTLDTFLAYEDEIGFSKDGTEYTNQRTTDIFESSVEDKSPFTDFNIEEKIEEFDFSKITHQNIETSDVIYLPLWNKASWSGLLVIPADVIDSKPYVGLVFKNEEGLNIFSKWKNENILNKVTIGIITGINKNHPLWYRVIIGENLYNQGFADLKNDMLFGVSSRLHTMEAESDYTINLLKQVITENKEFNFIPVLSKDLEARRLRTELACSKEINSIILKDVSEVDEKDFFLHQGILPIDVPVNLTDEERFIEIHIEEKKKRK
ncbi:hypothetical protein K9128_000458 [Listeria monocytogenes]|uniref:hypothetical protein n=1 Tax=Listeria monocytogenes TaxID=1639 RepID=UPI001750D92B|nr:hypothetical protein [Listeria monocytogenes]EAG8233296.1 hypothetical protein [Listeria monocytogenes]EAG8239211.1 hypothetical protein [Listeria monocytogenes]EAH0155665.1 hypothetical protein [Listeria monocytogenes]EAH3095594.1 hypothetical protein [Listeria monocytogenes]EAH4135076.1 hypothetical protein [Listeria monocytogenes]